MKKMLLAVFLVLGCIPTFATVVIEREITNPRILSVYCHGSYGVVNFEQYPQATTTQEMCLELKKHIGKNSPEAIIGSKNWLVSISFISEGNPEGKFTVKEALNNLR
jgi:hypothetical protein